MGFFSSLFSLPLGGNKKTNQPQNDPTDELRKIRTNEKGREELEKIIVRIKEGDAYGSWLIGGCYESGSIFTSTGSVAFPKDKDKARFWKLKSAVDGCDMAQYEIGRMFYYGSDLSDNLFEKNHEQSLKWFSLACKNNFYHALTALGEIYYTGDGAPLDYNKAFELFMLSVNHPTAKQFGLYNDNAALRIGEMYARGRGVEKNIAEAYRWLTLAGCDPNEYYAFPLKGMLSESDIQEAEALIEAWKSDK